jgi:hypothetical protein
MNDNRINKILEDKYMPSNQALLRCYVKIIYDSKYNLVYCVRNEILTKLFDNNFVITDPKLYFTIIFCNTLYNCHIDEKLVDAHTTVDECLREMYKRDINLILLWNRNSYCRDMKEEENVIPNNAFDKCCEIDSWGKKYYESSKIIYALQGDDLHEYFNM